MHFEKCNKNINNSQKPFYIVFRWTLSHTKILPSVQWKISICTSLINGCKSWTKFWLMEPGITFQHEREMCLCTNALIRDNLHWLYSFFLSTDSTRCLSQVSIQRRILSTIFSFFRFYFERTLLLYVWMMMIKKWD